jgi:hypothetical protein
MARNGGSGAFAAIGRTVRCAVKGPCGVLCMWRGVGLGGPHGLRGRHALRCMPRAVLYQRYAPMTRAGHAGRGSHQRALGVRERRASCWVLSTEPVLCDVLQAVMQVAHGLGECARAVTCCTRKSRRLADRAGAMVPALKELERTLAAPLGGVELATVQSLSVALVTLAKVRKLLPPCVSLSA